jgi:DNA-binding response OmpR family regulator/GGDEF domain-containing protein
LLNQGSIEGAHPIATDRPRRALVVVDAAAATLQKYFAAYGYETLTTTTDAAYRAISEFAPDVVIIELHRGGISGEDTSIALARRLRAEPATYALPLVFVWAEDERAVRSAALYVGADDYFALATPAAEVLARLDSLFWRVEADRRAAPVAGDQRLEIDNFMLLLDAVRDDIRGGASGTLGLIYAVARDGDQALEKAERDHTLSQAHSFFKLNLRRIDAIAFYGPTTLLVYLPRTKTVAAIEALSKLRDEFLNDCAGCDVAIGLASFPEEGSDVERMIEKAEAAVAYARAGGLAAGRIMTYEASQITSRPTLKNDDASEPQRRDDVAAETVVDQAAGEEESVQIAASQSEIADAQSATAAAAPIKHGAMQLEGNDSSRLASDAAAQERERRARGAIMPRRLLLTVSDAKRMAQINSLVRAAGYEARAAFDGQQALDLLRIERPDLLLLDYELDGINGLETLRRLGQQSGGRVTLPVVMLLPVEIEGARREAIELGAHSVITTPYDPTDLLDSVRMAGHVE